MASVKHREKIEILRKIPVYPFRWLEIAVGVVILGVLAQVAVLRAQPGNWQASAVVQKPGSVYVILWFDTEGAGPFGYDKVCSQEYARHLGLAHLSSGV